MHTADRRCAGTPGLPCAVVLRLMPRSPRRRIPFASVADGLAIYRGPVGPDNLHQLDTSNGCQDHTVLPSAASSSHTPRPARMLPEEVSTEAFKRRSSARRSIAHGIRPATTRASDAAASTATRTPRIVTPRTSLFMRRDDAKKTSISKKGKPYIFPTQSGRPKSR